MIRYDIEHSTHGQDIERLFYLQKAQAPLVAATTADQRIAKLKKLRETIMQHRNDIHTALHHDLRKPGLETDITEIKTTVTEINFAINHLRSWMRPQRVATPLMLFGTSSYIHHEPKGNVLVIAPWNFPFLLALGPVVGAIAAGNCVIVKPSEHTPHTSALLRKIVTSVFDEKEVAVVEGGIPTSEALLRFPFNHMFFTGGTQTGKLVMKAAAEHLSAVTLELGGKSPVVIDESANLKDAAAKIVFLKFMNNGQICISPDYVLVQESVLEPFLKEITAFIKKAYGTDSGQRQRSPDLCRMVNDGHFNRVQKLIEEARKKGATLHIGGTYDAGDKYIDPVVLTGVDTSMAVMQEEIFGPVLPVLTFRDREEASAFINTGTTPLSMYVFSKKQSFIDFMLQSTKAGDVCINECGHHFYNPNLPFGGLNASGIGKAHGRYFFDEFTNAKGVLRRYDIGINPLKLLFPPYKPIIQRLFKYIIRWP